MNTKTKNLISMLAVSSLLLLQACSKNEVKSEKIPQTNLKSTSSTSTTTPVVTMTATAMASASPTVSANAAVPSATMSANSYTKNSYTKQKAATRRSAVTHAATMASKKSVPMMAAPMATAVPTMLSSNMNAASTPMATFTPVVAQAPKKSGSHWPLIVAGIALVAAVGFYFWTKKAPPHNDFPLPPMGGLSPVSGFTAMRNKVKTETKKQSIWDKKIF